MSGEQPKAFLNAVKLDAGLQEKFSAAADPEEVAEIAKSAGFSLAPGDLMRVQSEISDQLLEGVAGGTAANACCYDTIC